MSELAGDVFQVEEVGICPFDRCIGLCSGVADQVGAGVGVCAVPVGVVDVEVSDEQGVLQWAVVGPEFYCLSAPSRGLDVGYFDLLLVDCDVYGENAILEFFVILWFKS